MRPKLKKREERMCDAISFRVLPAHRDFMEKIAEKHNVGLCEAARIIIEDSMARGLV